MIAALSACTNADTTETTVESTTTTDTEATTSVTESTSETSTTESAPNPALADPCELLSDEELRSIGATDNTLGATRADDFNGVFPGCTFGAFASLYTEVSEGWMDAADGEPVSGIGDEAFFAPSWSRLTVRFGEDRLMFQLGVGGKMEVEDELSTLEDMAELVRTKL